MEIRKWSIATSYDTNHGLQATWFSRLRVTLFGDFFPCRPKKKRHLLPWSDKKNPHGPPGAYPPEKKHIRMDPKKWIHPSPSPPEATKLMWSMTGHGICWFLLRACGAHPILGAPGGIFASWKKKCPGKNAIFGEPGKNCLLSSRKNIHVIARFPFNCTWLKFLQLA